MSIKTDLQLIQEVKSGDKKSFEVLMQRHEKFLLKIIARMTRDLNAAEDIVQDAFIKAYKRLHLFEARASFRSWLYQIAVNTARNRFRKHARETLTADTVDIAVDSQSENHMMALDVRGILQSEIQRLPERQKMALNLRIFEDLSFKEIAGLMNCPYDTAKANYRHALLKLKERLDGNLLLKGWSQAATAPRTLLDLAANYMEVDG